MTNSSKLLLILLVSSLMNPSLSAGAPDRLLNALKFFHVVKHGERILLERLGKFNRVLEPGLHFKTPILEAARIWSGSFTQSIDGGKPTTLLWMSDTVDMRERSMEINEYSVITRDNVGMKIRAIVFYRVVDPEKAVYGVENLTNSIQGLSKTNLRNVVGSLHLDETLESRNLINERLCQSLGGSTDEYGVEITKIELQEIDPPTDIRKAMEQEMTAERTKRAEILNAEADKKSAILRAEGSQESAVREATGSRDAAILAATGESQAIEMLAKAEAARIQKIRDALGEEGASAYVGLQYIEALPKVTDGKGKVVVPYDAAALLGATSVLKDMFKNDSAKAA